MHAEETWLHNGWDWLRDNSSDARHAEMEVAWLERLQRYEETYRLAFPEQFARAAEQDRAAD